MFESGEGTDEFTGMAFGALLFHDELQQGSDDICHMPSTVDVANGVLTGGAVADVSCSLTVVAPAGSAVQVKVMETALRRNTLSLYNSTSTAPANLIAVLTGRDAGRVVTAATGTLTVVESEKQPCTRRPCAAEPARPTAALSEPQLSLPLQPPEPQRQRKSRSRSDKKDFEVNFGSNQHHPSNRYHHCGSPRGSRAPLAPRAAEAEEGQARPTPGSSWAKEPPLLLTQRRCFLPALAPRLYQGI